MSASRSLRPNKVAFYLSPARSLNSTGKCLEKSGPFSLTFCQIVALMFPHRSVVAGRLDEWLVAICFLLV